MTTIRRVYAYLLALAGLAMLTLAAANLLQLLVDLALQPTAVGGGSPREMVSFSAAEALVGLPVWLVHWRWISRSVRVEARERASTLRRLYVYVVLTGATLELVGSSTDALSSAFAWLLSPAMPGASLDAVVRPLPFVFVAGLVWLAHWRVAATDRALVGERGGSATLRRWYVYGAAFLGLVLVLSGTQAILESLWRLAAQLDGSAGLRLSRPAADALVGLGLWWAHWMALPARGPADDWEGDDAASVLRSVYLFGALATGVIGCLLGLSQLLYYAVVRGLGVEHPVGLSGNLLDTAAAPASTALVFGTAWVYQRQALRHPTPTLAGAPARVGVERLYAYLVALVALGLLAVGVAGLLWTLASFFFPVSAVTPNDTAWREQLALFATLSLVGLPVWVLHWRQRAIAVAEARSLARRLYVFLSLIVAMLALVGSAAAALYQVLGLALGASLSVAIAADLAHAVAVASVAAAVAAYQWQVLRADAGGILSEPVTPTPVDSELPVALASVVVRLQGADAAVLSTAVSALQASGIQVTVIASSES